MGDSYFPLLSPMKDQIIELKPVDRFDVGLNMLAYTIMYYIMPLGILDIKFKS